MRKRALTGARGAFLVAGGWFIWRSLEGRGDALRAGLAATPAWGTLLSLAMVCAGLVCTGILWRAILSAFGDDVGLVPAFAIFFFGQLGKYIPGSVWSFAAQAGGARRLGVPVLKTVNASLIFLGLHVATGAVLGFGGALLLGDRTPVPTWVAVLGAAGGLLALLPRSVNAAARLVGRIGTTSSLGAGDLGRLLVPMLAAWMCYAISLVALRPAEDPLTLGLIIVAYAIAYVAGVVVFIAPAGVGARETVFVMITGHALGIGGAAALALLTRVVMTAGDLALAAAANFVDRSWRRTRTEELPPS